MSDAVLMELGVKLDCLCLLGMTEVQVDFPPHWKRRALKVKFKTPDGASAVAVSVSAVALTFGKSIATTIQGPLGGIQFDRFYDIKAPIKDGVFELDVAAYLKSAPDGTKVDWTGTVAFQVLFFGKK